MSVPATGWAVAQGRAHKLPTFARMLLVVLADILGRTGKLCPSVPYLAEFTGMSERTVDKFLPVLIQHGLIAASKSVGNVTHYVLLRPDTPASLAPVTPARLAGVNGAHPHKAQQEPPQDTTRTPASLAPEPYRTKKEPKTRAEDARENPSVLSFPTLGRKSPAPAPEPQPDPDTAALTAAIAGCFRSTAKHAPGVAPLRTVQQQLDELEAKPTPRHFRGLEPVRTPEEQIAILLGNAPMPAPRPELVT
jgi:Helix-turn-helix domain